MNSWNIGDWCWHVRLASPCRVIDREVLWGDVFFRVWLPAKDAVVLMRVSQRWRTRKPARWISTRCWCFALVSRKVRQHDRLG
jgi:hypothetical protein